MTADALALLWQRTLIAAVLFGSVVAFWRGTLDVFNTVKATIVVLGAIAVGLTAACRAVRSGRVQLPLTTAWWAVGLLVAGLLAATATAAAGAPSAWRAVVGQPGRHTGLALYLACLLLFAATLRTTLAASAAPLARTLIGAAIPVILYALAQAAGRDPFTWRTVEGGPAMFSTFGNINFLSAFLGIVAPLALWGALTSTHRPVWRALSAAVGLAACATAAASTSSQGPAAALIGTLFTAAAAVCARASAPARRRLLCAIATAPALLAAVLLLADAGPPAALRAEVVESLATRTPKWAIALEMIRDRPLLGFGLDRYADWYLAYRPPALAAATGIARSVDNPHNVLLHLLTGGGLLLGAGWAAFVTVTAKALVRGLRQRQGEDRLLLGGLGGAWLAYQAQALVSIDVPPLAVMHFVLAGAIVALGSAPPLRAWRVPRLGPRPLPVAAAGLAAAALVWAVTLPVRADRIAQAGESAGERDVGRALNHYRRAAGMAFWEARYPSLEGGQLVRVGRPEAALDAHLRAAARDPRGLWPALAVARLYAQLGDDRRASQWYEHVAVIDPSTPEVLVEAGRFHIARGDETSARALLKRALASDPGNAAATAALALLRSDASAGQAAEASNGLRHRVITSAPSAP